MSDHATSRPSAASSAFNSTSTPAPTSVYAAPPRFFAAHTSQRPQSYAI